MKTRNIVIVLAVLSLALIWYLFRPELLFVSREVNEAFPGVVSAESSGPVLLASGPFHSVAHETRGQASIYRLADGRMVLRFTEFETSNGPDVQVYLVAADDATDNETVTRAGFINLAGLKGTAGDQNYELPGDVDLSKYRSVTVWCRRFGVNFGTAPLIANQS